MSDQEILDRPGAYRCEECDQPIPGPHNPEVGSLAHINDCSRHTKNSPYTKRIREEWSAIDPNYPSVGG